VLWVTVLLHHPGSVELQMADELTFSCNVFKASSTSQLELGGDGGNS